MTGHDVTFVAYGLRVGIHTDNPEILPSLLDRLPPGSRPSTSASVDRAYSVVDRDGARDMTLLVDGRVLVATGDADLLCAAFEADLQLHVAEMAHRGVFVHAGAVGWHGRAIILPGSSRSGKTTMAAELVRAGATYYSDEYAVLDARGRLHPYARPLSIRQPDGAKLRCGVEALGGRSGTRPLPVGMVVMTHYEPGASWNPERLSPGHCVLTLLAHTVSVRRQPGAALAALVSVAKDAVLLRSVRGEARETVDAMLRTLRAVPEFTGIESGLPHDSPLQTHD
jgi:hypothetical protein